MPRKRIITPIPPMRSQPAKAEVPVQTIQYREVAEVEPPEEPCYLYRSYRISDRDANGNFPDFQPIDGSWRDCPPEVITLVTESWRGWKGGGAISPTNTINWNNTDWDLSTFNSTVPVVTVSKRFSSIYRTASYQFQLRDLQSKLEDLEAVRSTVQKPLIDNLELQKSIEATKATRSDPEWLASQESSLIGWEQREVELRDRLATLDTQKEEYELKLTELLALDLKGIEEWRFSLDEIV